MRITEMQTTFDTHLKDMQSSLVTRFEEVKTTLNTRLDEVSTRMTILEGRLAPLDDLPLLSNRLSAAEETITQVQSEQANLRRAFGELCSANSAAAPDISNGRRIEKLERDYQILNAAQRSQSKELVISGLQISDTTSPKGAVYAALKFLDGGLLERDILNVRKMRLKPPPTCTPSDTHAEESRNENTEESSTKARQSPPQPSRVNAKLRITPLIVSLSSHELAVSLINAKIKMGKVHTSQLCTELLTQANASPPLSPSVININEWLPPNVHHLHISAGIEAKKRGFVTFVSHGNIYIKKKKEDRNTHLFC